MKKQRNEKEICWIYRERKRFKLSSSFRSLFQIFSELGIEVLEIPISRQQRMWDIAAEKMVGHPVAILCHDLEKDWIQELSSFSKKTVPTCPIIWVYTPRTVSFLPALQEFGLDDFWPSAIPKEAILASLFLREKEKEKIRVQDHSWNELEWQMAKTETILKQREEFLSICAHDLRSPLGLIQSCLSLILNDSENKKKFSSIQIELLTRVHKQASYAVCLVGDLLDLMTVEQGLMPHYEVILLDSFLLEFLHDFSYQARQKGIQLDYENSIPGWRVIGDGIRIRQMLQNLMVNALKFTDTGKRILLRVNPFQGRRASDPPHSMIIVNLVDEGTGIAPQKKEKIFDRFSQVRSYAHPEGSHGLGLSVAKQIAQLHDGNLWVESEIGKGSTFSILFRYALDLRATENQNRKRRISFLKREKPIFLIGDKETEEYKHRYPSFLKEYFSLIFAKQGMEVLTLANHFYPHVIGLHSNLPRIHADRVATMLKSDLTLSQIPILFFEDLREIKSNHNNSGSNRNNREEKKVLSDFSISFPLTEEKMKQIQAFLEEYYACEKEAKAA